MKAILNEKYGPPEALILKEVPMPDIQDDEVLVRVIAASVNPYDWHMMRGSPFFLRFIKGFWRPDDPKLGADMAGVVKAVGHSVTQIKPGDAVYGDIGSGGFAEYAAAKEKMLAPIPTGLSFAEAAAIPIAGLTAIQCLRDHGGLQAGEKILINGASGGVGTYAVQMAKAMGAEVTGVCSTRNVELVYALGADHVIDYTQADFASSGQQYDMILDNVGNRSYGDLVRALAPGGRCVAIGFNLLLSVKMALLSRRTARRTGKKLGGMMAKINQADLLEINKLVESGQLRSVIDSTYPFVEIAAAIRHQEDGHARGKVIVDIAPVAEVV